MIVTKFEEPWEHFEVQNFLNDIDFQGLIEYTNSHIEFNRKTVESYDRYLYEFKLYSKINEFLKKIFLNLISDIYSENFYDNKKYLFTTSLSICTKDYEISNIHTDVVGKVITGILYLSQFGKGTELYKSKSKDSISKIIDWVPNKILIFKRTENSWHNFNSIGTNQERITYNLNLLHVNKFKIYGGIYKKGEGKI